MKNSLFCALIIGFVSVSCIKNTPGIPPGVSYFALGDSKRATRLSEYDFIVEQVDLQDTTRILMTKRLSSSLFVQLYGSQKYKLVFEANNAIFNPGLNKICKLRFRYEGLPGVVDWLEFKNTAEEWVNPTDVKFNGKPIIRQNSNEPVDGSYLYVLQ